MAVIELTESNIEDTINQNDIVIIDFWASWCAPCRAFAPIFEAAADNHPDVVFTKINTEEQQGLASYFQIRSIPTLMIFRDQIALFNQAGMLSAPQIDELLGKVKELDMDQIRAEIEREQNTTQ
ncbi:thioredoxin [Thiorhodospira sibirica]|uniref:thioredoxin n=1 Tax=Thiorhodospira sibirica TaxID=154347 RepID=UPI00022C0B33|nr:thioredoxin [Thiorhodospira sibirica]